MESNPDQWHPQTIFSLAPVSYRAIIGGIADYVVYRYNIKDDIARTKKMGLTNLPTMVINGEPKFVSIIPSKQELVEAVNKVKK